MCSSGDTDVAHLVSVGELAQVLMCALLVTETGLFFLEGELAWFLICTLPVTKTMAF